MKKIFYLIAVMGLIITSCAKTENPNPNEEPTYSFEIGAEKEGGGTDETRVEMIDGLMHWSVDDQVGMFVFPVGGTNLAIRNLAMTGLHTQPTRATTFKGKLTQSEINNLKFTTGYERYYHFSYYPYSETARHSYSGWTHSLRFELPGSITVTKNVFPKEYAHMYAYESSAAAPPMTWLDGNKEQQWSEKMSFNYKHVLSYIRLKIDANLMGLDVTGIRMQSTSSLISGFVTIDTESGVMKKINYANPSGSLYMVIPEGMNVGDEIYIPLPPVEHKDNISSDTYWLFTFTFSNGATYEKKIPIDRNGNIKGFNLEQGKIYNMSFKLPFIADFVITRNGLTNGTTLSNPFDFRGQSYLSNGLEVKDYRVTFGNDNAGFRQYAFATPPLNLSGKTEVPVEVTATIWLRARSTSGLSVSPLDLFYVNAAPTNATSYDYSTDGIQVPFIRFSADDYVIPLTLNPENSRIGISFEPREYNSFPYYTFISMAKLIVMPL